ncbi:unnamed protein product [Brassica oleracea]
MLISRHFRLAHRFSRFHLHPYHPILCHHVSRNCETPFSLLRHGNGISIQVSRVFQQGDA